MGRMLSLFANSLVGESEALMLAFLVFFLALILIFRVWIGSGRKASLRPIKAFGLIDRVTDRAVEMGQAAVVSVGSGSIGGETTLPTLAGLQIARQVIRRAAVAGIPLVVPVADPVTMVAAQGMLRRGYAEAGASGSYDPSQVQLVALAPDGIAYAAGVMAVLRREPAASHVAAGHFGEEYLLIGETGAAKGIEQVAGSADPRVLPFQYATSDELLIGEELYAGGAYLSKLPGHLASLMAQDWLRTVLILIILLGILLRTFLR